MTEPVGLFDAQFADLERSMTIAAKRQETISHNIANAKTPGYQPLVFDEELMRAVKRQDQKQVVLEDELASLTENSMKYSAYVKLLSSKISILKAIATQGRR
ncbi:hypothetical protein HZB07_00760 [Candidatus Saganbacteria bacterium]|nr:hypothetical protein [Candidatus Saganbacteria bacterium]